MQLFAHGPAAGTRAAAVSAAACACHMARRVDRARRSSAAAGTHSDGPARVRHMRAQHRQAWRDASSFAACQCSLPMQALAPALLPPFAARIARTPCSGVNVAVCTRCTFCNNAARRPAAAAWHKRAKQGDIKPAQLRSASTSSCDPGSSAKHARACQQAQWLLTFFLTSCTADSCTSSSGTQPGGTLGARSWTGHAQTAPASTAV